MKLYQIARYGQLAEEADTIADAVVIYNRLNVDGADVVILKLVTWKTRITDVTEAPSVDK